MKRVNNKACGWFVDCVQDSLCIAKPNACETSRRQKSVGFLESAPPKLQKLGEYYQLDCCVPVIILP